MYFSEVLTRLANWPPADIERVNALNSSCRSSSSLRQSPWMYSAGTLCSNSASSCGNSLSWARPCARCLSLSACTWPYDNVGVIPRSLAVYFRTGSRLSVNSSTSPTCRVFNRAAAATDAAASAATAAAAAGPCLSSLNSDAKNSTLRLLTWCSAR